MMILIADRPLPPLTNAVSRHGFPRHEMAAVMTRLTSRDAASTFIYL